MTWPSVRTTWAASSGAGPPSTSSTCTDDLEVIERVGAHLRANIPVQQGATIVDGDYRFGNCLTDPVTGRINAILDWELCTLVTR